MATVVHEHVDVPIEGFRISWGGVWAGVLTVMGTLLFLTTLGLAIGISALDPGGAPDAGAFGTGAAIWSALSLLIALFVGGMAATRLGMVFDKAAGAFEGALVWVLSFLVILWLASSGVRLVASGISSLFSGVTQTVGAVTGAEDLSAGSVDQILSRLRNPETARTIAGATGMPEQEVASTLNSVAQRVEASRDNPAQAAAEVRRGAEELMARARQQLPAAAERVQESATRTAWITFGAMLISLAAAVAGAMIGRSRAMKRIDRYEIETVTAAAQARTREL